MEKSEMSSSAETPSARPSAPPVSSSPSHHPSGLPPPPTYEEAIAQSNIGNVPPYPINENNMPMPQVVDVAPVYITQPRGGSQRDLIYSPPNYVVAPETRTSRRPGTHILGPGPVKMQCLSCSLDIKTSVVSDHQPMAHVCCLILCVLGCCLCSCLPYCMSAFMSVHHFCPRCKVYIGTWKGFEPSRRFMAVRV